MNLHAATTVDGRDRNQLERLSRYLLRPPFSTDAIQRLPDGRVRLDIARRGRSVTMSAEQFIAKLIALVPPPSVPMVRYAGVFSNRHHLRAAIAPAPARCPEQSQPEQTRLLTFSGRPVDTKNPGPVTPSKLAWAQLLARVFGVDVLSCIRPGCGGKLRATAAVLHSREIALLLHGARGPPKPSPPGQLSFLNIEA
ncbi:MAG: transposase [Nannocystaceae bacterium]|nr:transposase [Nannocystaceae bacterium]